MSSVNAIDQVLAQMRRLADQAGGVAGSDAVSGAAPATPGDRAGASDFAELLKQSVDRVNALQKESGRLAEAFSAGDPNVDVAQVMIALQKSGVAFQAMTQVRNKLVEAYREVMSMQM